MISSTFADYWKLGGYGFSTWSGLVGGIKGGFRVTAPFVLKTKSDTSYEFDALVHDFGGERGMVLMEKWESEKADAAAAQGYGYSSMSAGPYDRDSTVGALRDWGWRGESDAPSWLNEKAT